MNVLNNLIKSHVDCMRSIPPEGELALYIIEYNEDDPYLVGEMMEMWGYTHHIWIEGQMIWPILITDLDLMVKDVDFRDWGFLPVPA